MIPLIYNKVYFTFIVWNPHEPFKVIEPFKIATLVFLLVKQVIFL